VYVRDLVATYVDALGEKDSYQSKANQSHLIDGSEANHPQTQ